MKVEVFSPGLFRYLPKWKDHQICLSCKCPSMKPKHPVKILLLAALMGLLVFALSCSAQMLRALHLQAAGWLICPGYVSGIFNSAFVHSGLAATLMLVLPRLNRNCTHVEADA
jgi:hypothetical protein